jgi:hypothetical protein
LKQWGLLKSFEESGYKITKINYLENNMATTAETNPVIMALLSSGALRRASFVQAMQNTYRFAFAQDKAARKARTERSLFNQSRFEYVSDLFEKRKGITLNENGRDVSL